MNALPLLFFAMLAVGSPHPSSQATLKEVSKASSAQDADGQIFAQLKQAGADLTKPTEVNFYLYLPSKQAANRVAKVAQDKLLKAKVRASNYGKKVEWLCLLTGKFVPEKKVIQAYGRRFTQLAKKEKGEYDGWEAAVTR